MSARWVAYLFGVAGLLMTGGIALVLPFATGGFSVLVFWSLPLLASGFWLARGGRFARTIGVAVPATYATVVAVFTFGAATGCGCARPPEGVTYPAQPIEPLGVITSLIFAAIAFSIAVGAPARSRLEPAR